MMRLIEANNPEDILDAKYNMGNNNEIGRIKTSL